MCVRGGSTGSGHLREIARQVVLKAQIRAGGICTHRWALQARLAQVFLLSRSTRLLPLHRAAQLLP